MNFHPRVLSSFNKLILVITTMIVKCCSHFSPPPYFQMEKWKHVLEIRGRNGENELIHPVLSPYLPSEVKMDSLDYLICHKLHSRFLGLSCPWMSFPPFPLCQFLWFLSAFDPFASHHSYFCHFLCPTSKYGRSVTYHIMNIIGGSEKPLRGLSSWWNI